MRSVKRQAEKIAAMFKTDFSGSAERQALGLARLETMLMICIQDTRCETFHEAGKVAQRMASQCEFDETHSMQFLTAREACERIADTLMSRSDKLCFRSDNGIRLETDRAQHDDDA